MLERRSPSRLIAGVAIGLLFLSSGAILGDEIVLEETFEGVTAESSTEILTGSGYNELDGWSDDLLGEWAYAGTWGDGAVTSASAGTVLTGGSGDSKAGLLTVTGGTFTPDAGGWYAGLFWPVSPPTLDTSRLILEADLKSNIPAGAPYELRLEAQKFVPFGLDEPFTTVTGTGGGQILAPGDLEGWTTNWDDGISGEAAFAGPGDAGEVFGGVYVNGVIGGGYTGGGGEIVVDQISHAATNGWYAGMVWENQRLPSTDLSQVELKAWIRGTAIPANGETLGKYALRIEDADFDWLAFNETATGDWQEVGGPLVGGLNPAEEGGFGDGLFDATRGPFKVVVVFDNTAAHTWGFGGTLTVDDMFLTGGEATEAVGSAYFAGTVGTTMETFGGPLDNAVSTFVNVDEDFDTVTGEGDIVFFDSASGTTSWTPGWNLGIEGEAAFAGYWGAVTVTGGAAAAGLTTGGVEGGGAGKLEVWDVNVTGAGGWWAGLMWQNQTFPDGDLANIELWADIKGIAGTGAQLGKYHLRIEDAEGDFLAYVENGVAPDVQADFVTVGGSLGDPQKFQEGTFIGDGTFHPDHGPHTVVVAFNDEWNTWNSGGTLVVDNLSLTAPGFGAGSDTFAAVVSMADDTGDWGSDAVLTVDNVTLTATGAFCTDNSGCDDDNACTLDTCDQVSGTCEFSPRAYGDVDGNGALNLFDIFCILDLLGGVPPGAATCTPGNADVAPCAGNDTLNLLDVFGVLDAVSGTDPCSCPGP